MRDCYGENNEQEGRRGKGGKVEGRRMAPREMRNLTKFLYPEWRNCLLYLKEEEEEEGERGLFNLEDLGSAFFLGRGELVS